MKPVLVHWQKCILNNIQVKYPAKVIGMVLIVNCNAILSVVRCCINKEIHNNIYIYDRYVYKDKFEHT